MQQAANILIAGAARVIRIRLSSDDVARIRLVDTPDFDLELMGSGALAARHWHWPAMQRLARWRHETQRRQDAHALSAVTGLYMARSLPDMFGQPAETQVHAVVDHLEGLAAAHRLTKFNRALADGDVAAHKRLHAAVADLRATAVDPYRRRISSVVARTGARTIARAASGGIGAALSHLDPHIRWNGSTLMLDTDTKCDLELDGRTLVLRPLALTAGFVCVGDLDPDTVVLCYPTPDVLGAPDARPPTASPALSALLGTSRADALAAVGRFPAITTGQLAEALGLSPAAASRHATVLREAGLVDTLRDGPAVRHRVTRLGAELLAG